jgi:hypothetical protein
MRKILAIAILATCIITAGCQKSMTKEEAELMKQMSDQSHQRTMAMMDSLEKNKAPSQPEKNNGSDIVTIAGQDFNITSKTKGWTILQGTTYDIHDVIYNAMKKIQINVGSGTTDVLSGSVHVKLADGHKIYFNMKFITTDSTKLHYSVSATNSSGLSEVHLNYLLEQIIKGM